MFWMPTIVKEKFEKSVSIERNWTGNKTCLMAKHSLVKAICPKYTIKTRNGP